MSFILDALRSAEAERRQGRVPDLQSVPVAPALDAADADSAAGWQRWRGPAMAAALVAAALAWWFGRGADATPPRDEPPVAAAPLPRPQEPTRASPMPTPMPILPASAGADAAVAVPAPAPAPARAAAPAPTAIANPAAAPPAVSPPAAARSASAAAAPPPARAGSAAGPAPAAAAGPAAPARVVALHELPDDVRRALPPLNVSGASYSQTPANRLLFLNGQLLREGDAVTPEITLEAIELRSAVLLFRGQRFRISY